MFTGMSEYHTKAKKDLIDSKFGKWTVIDNAEKRGRSRYYKCKCTCGKIQEVRQSALTSGMSKGCRKCSKKELLSDREKTIIADFKRVHGDKYDYSLMKYNGAIKKIRIICDIHGEFSQIPHSHLNGSGCKKCGYNVKRSDEHGLVSHNLYGRWAGIKNRCLNKNSQDYKYYGGRGIKVCAEWKNSFLSFYDWAINNGYSEELSIDRIDNNGNYEPSNCRWVTHKVQMNNTRVTNNKRTKETKQ